MNKILPCLALALGLSASAQSLTNASFEANTYAVRPGRVTDNGPITGWTASNGDRVGLNPAGAVNDFANNGAVPDGSKVAWIQSDALGPQVLSQTLTGLTPGQAYKVTFRANAKSGSTARFRVGFDGGTTVEGEVQPVGGTAAYRYVSAVLNATATNHILQVANTTGVNTNNVLLADLFSVAPGAGGWSTFNWSNDATSQVGGGKTYTHAVNFGAAGTTVNTTINGVLFNAVTGINPGVAGSFSTTGLGSAPVTDAGNAAITAGGGAANLMSQFVYGGNNQSITLLGLTPGVEYEATIYSAGWEAGVRTATFERGVDRLSINQDMYGNNACIGIRHRYVAPVSGSVTLAFNALKLGTTIHVYGFSNADLGTTAPVITASPRSRVAAPGSTSVFRTIAGSSQPLQYQWRKNNADLPLETNPTLSVGPVDGTSVAGYSVVVSNALGVATSAVANLTLGPVSNPSFESDAFANNPGYSAANAPIIGWDSTTPTQVGVNPTLDGTQPFLLNGAVSNGVVPDGAQAAYMQSMSTGAVARLSTTVAGLTPGQPYTLGFRFNARTANKPVLHASIDGGIPVDARVSTVGAGNPYRYGAIDFTPAGTTASLLLTVDPAAANDSTLLLDDFTVTPSSQAIGHQPWTDDLSAGTPFNARVARAYNFGSAQGTVINDVVFTGVGGANPAVPDKFSTTGFASVFANDANNVRTAGGGGAILARDFLYNGAVHTLVVTGLIAGVEYETSLYCVGFDLKTYGRAHTIEVDGRRQTVNQGHYDNDNGIRITARHVAGPGGASTLTVRPTDAASSMHLYGFLTQEVASTNAPSFYVQPRSEVWVGTGEPVRVNEAQAGGEEPLSFAWHRNGEPVPGQNARVLDLSAPLNADSGDYTLVVSNARGAATSSVVRVEIGLPLPNWSFEADTYTVAPGYQSLNGGVISGWTFDPLLGLGLNPASGSPFANNGVIPHGVNVAFLQQDGASLTTTVSGLTPGQGYYVRLHANARAAHPSPRMAIRVDGEAVYPPTVINPGAYVVHTSAFFLATGPTASVRIEKSAGPAGGDSTLLIDAVTVHAAGEAPLAFLLQPPPLSWVADGSPLVLNTIVNGTLPLSCQWRRNGEDVPGGTSPSLDLSPVSVAMTGAYTLVVTNATGAITSEVAVVNVGYPLRGLAGTGVDDAGVPLPDGTVDPHYRLTASADAVFTGPNLVTFATGAQPGTYAANDARSRWIHPGGAVTNGLYTYRLPFLVDEQDPAAIQINGRLGVDNNVTEVRLNGNVTGVTATGFTALAPFSITNGFVSGVNVLEFVVRNAAPPGPSALRVEISGLGLPSSGVPAAIVEDPVSLEAQPGSNVRLAAGAVGSATLGYQWYVDGTNLIAGATQPWLNLTAVDEADEGDYTLRVSNGLGDDTSLPARLTVLGPLPVTITSGAGALSVAWEATSEPWTLWETPSLLPPVSWTQVPGTIVTTGEVKVLTFPQPDGLRYYRLEKPAP